MTDKDKVARDILSDITVQMKYARYMPEKERRETWAEIVDRNKAILKKKLLIKIINKITSFGLNWDYVGYYGIMWDLSTAI